MLIKTDKISGDFRVIKESKYGGFILDINGVPTFIRKEFEVKLTDWIPLENHPFPSGTKVMIKRNDYDVKYEFEGAVCSGCNYNIWCVFTDELNHGGSLSVRRFDRCSHTDNKFGYKYELNPYGDAYQFKIKSIK